MGAISELLLEAMGIGELGLLVPALSRLAQAGRYIAWIAPPYLPYAPALAQAGIALKRVLVVQTRGVQESLWATEQTLRCPAFGAVLSWPSGIVDKNVRRLQLAAEAGGTLGILYRPAEAAPGTHERRTHRRHSQMPRRPGRRAIAVGHQCYGCGLEIALRFCSERLNRPIVTCTET